MLALNLYRNVSARRRFLTGKAGTALWRLFSVNEREQKILTMHTCALTSFARRPFHFPCAPHPAVLFSSFMGVALGTSLRAACLPFPTCGHERVRFPLWDFERVSSWKPPFLSRRVPSQSSWLSLAAGGRVPGGALVWREAARAARPECAYKRVPLRVIGPTVPWFYFLNLCFVLL